MSAKLFAVAAAALFFGTLTGAWLTSEFWKAVVAIPCAGGTGVLTALALYARSKRPFVALAIGFVVALATLIATGAVTIWRWED